jgi:hypothetical protein
MSPVSRKRRPKRSGQSRKVRKPPTAESVQARLVKAFDSIDPDADPVEVELVASSLMGTLWLVTPDPLLGLDVVEYAARRATPAAMALLRCWAAVGTTDAERQAAATAATRLRDAGVADPSWAARLSQLRVGECWQIEDVYGDEAQLVCAFGHGGDETRHALVALLDFDGPGVWLKDIAVTGDVPTVLGESRKEAESDPLLTLTRVTPARTRQLLERALRAMDEIRLPSAGTGDSGAKLRALALALCRVMPAPDKSVVDEPASAAIDVDAVVAEFLGSPHARDLPRSPVTNAYAERIVGSLMNTDPPLWISPALVADLLRDHLFDEYDNAEALPAIVDAWVRWSAERNGLPEAAVAELTEVAARLGERFLREHGDEAEFWETGLERIRDPIEFAEALKRRQFAFRTQTPTSTRWTKTAGWS